MSDRMEILVLMSTWEQKRHLFTEEEKVVLREAMVGETVCPRAALTAITEKTRPLIERLGVLEAWPC